MCRLEVKNREDEVIGFVRMCYKYEDLRYGLNKEEEKNIQQIHQIYQWKTFGREYCYVSIKHS